MIAPKLAKLLIWKMRQVKQSSSWGIDVNAVRQTDAAIDVDGPALEQHCTNVSRRPYSQPRALRECIQVKIISVLVLSVLSV